MVEIRYTDNYEVVDLAGCTVGEAREQFKAEFGIPGKAKARLNGRPVKGKLEDETALADDDKLTFADPKGRGAILVGALMLALAITGGVFAYGYTTDSTSLTVTAAGADFAAVSANTSDLPTWTTFGFFKGSISGPKPIFDIDTNASNYSGDMVVTISIANADELVSVYRVLVLKIQAIDGVGAKVDINDDATVDGKDFALLTLGNGSVDLFMGGAADNYTVRVASGFYVSHIWGQGWNSGDEIPLLFAEVAQR